MNYNCGIKAVDVLTKGLKDGDVTVIAAKPGGGKTNMLLNMAHGFEASGANVLFVSLESDSLSIQMRLMARTLGIPFTDLVAKDISPATIKKIKDYSAHSGSRIGICSASYRTPLQTITNSISARHAARSFKVLVLDTLDLIEGGLESKSQIVYAAAMRRLRVLGAECGFATVVSANVSRTGSRDDWRPSVFCPMDLNGGNELYSMADNIFMLTGSPNDPNKKVLSGVKLRYSDEMRPLPYLLKFVPDTLQMADYDDLDALKPTKEVTVKDMLSQCVGMGGTQTKGLGEIRKV